MGDNYDFIIDDLNKKIETFGMSTSSTYVGGTDKNINNNPDKKTICNDKIIELVNKSKIVYIFPVVLLLILIIKKPEFLKKDKLNKHGVVIGKVLSIWNVITFVLVIEVLLIVLYKYLCGQLL
jgi:hypothetical protein